MVSPVRQLPNKVLLSRVTSKEDLESWPYEDFSGDPYWNGGSTPKPYRWELQCSINTQVHGDPSTREPYQYNGFDVFVGDWIADTTNGISLKITQVVSKASNEVVIVVEDVDRYNTFMSEYGDGLFTVPTDTIIFSISDARMPILNPLPNTLGAVGFTGEISARFQNNNPVYRYRFVQPGHSVQDNDAVWVDPADGQIKTVSDENSTKQMIGTVDRVGPGQDIFYIIPSTKIVEGIDPALPGQAGSTIYVDVFTGELTVDPSSRTKAAYLQLTDATPDITRSQNDLVDSNATMGVNTIDVDFFDTTLESVASAINGLTDQHGVHAEVKSGETVSETDSGQLAYGIVACIGTGTSAQINGFNVFFNDTTFGEAEFGFPAVNAVDMAIAINDASIPNISAIGSSSISLRIINSVGGSINITNLTGDDSGIPFAGNGSCSGVPLSNSTSGVNFLELTNESGNGIIVSNEVGTPVDDLQITSVRNGELPKGLVIEQYVTESGGGVKVYATIDQLPAFGQIGEQAYVIDSTDDAGNKANEWSMWLWDGSQWVRTSDEDSATTDAHTIQAAVSFDSDNTVYIGTLSGGTKVTSVFVDVTTVFDGSPTLDIGDENDFDRLMSDDYIDLSQLETFSVSPDFVYNTENDNDIIATFTSGGATQGNATIIVTYV